MSLAALNPDKMIAKSSTTADPAAFVLIETTAYSGATLLAFLLGAHPQIATVGEMDGLIASENPDLYLCSCGKKIKECEFWQAVKAAMAKRGFEFDVAHFNTEFRLRGSRWVQYLRLGSFRHHLLDSWRDSLLQAWPEERRQLKLLVARNQAFVESVLAVTGKTVFVDTSKDRLRLKVMHKFSTLDMRAIHLVRDPRGVAASYERRGQGAIRGTTHWAKLHRRVEVTLKALPPEKSVRVRYEDLCRDARGVLAQLYGFCGVDPEFQVPDFRSIPHHIVGNEMRLQNITEIKPDERWRTLLSGEQLSQIEAIAGRLSRSYGYER